MQAHSVPIHAYMGALVFLPVHTWVCVRAGPQSSLLHIYGYCGRPYAYTCWPHQVQRLHWTQRLEGSISCVDGVAEVA